MSPYEINEDIEISENLQSGIPEELTKEDILGNNPNLQQNDQNRNQRITQLIQEWYYDKPQRAGSSQIYRRRYTEFDTVLHWSKEGQNLPKDSYMDSIVPQTTIGKYFIFLKNLLNGYFLMCFIEQENLLLLDLHRE